ncbi:MAG: Multidrug resistance protein MexA [Luteibacter sp.]|uniref:efflux RND transporter periplasmic adaptor subunit n=1 Tax=Luteibacter sp. TaxID=1886636 RepID=UPI00137F393F|nr:efflux RND transporter periplasmic adaptor subunit [Luteibacter sp.]KAF1007246.1 MAG: Multidrug resistance protein MexA [Luteibacter sp.]
MHETASLPPTVGVVTLAVRPYRHSVDLPGRTAAFLVAPVVPQVTGVVQERRFTEGAQIKAGDVLYQIDPAPYRAALESAQGALAKASAAVLSARPLARRDAELARIDAVSQEELEAAQATLRQDEAAVLAARADVDTARIRLGYTQVKAPISGTAGLSAFTVGALVTENQANALVTLYAYDPIYVDVTQSSADVLALRAQLAAGTLRTDSEGGARIRLTLEDGRAYPHEGRLAFSGIDVNPGTGAITLRAVVPNPERLLMPGMYVHATVEQGVKQEALLVPQQAITYDAAGNASAWVVDAADRPHRQTVVLGDMTDGSWVVERGLKAGDRVVVEGSQNIVDGDRVTPHVAKQA